MPPQGWGAERSGSRSRENGTAAQRGEGGEDTSPSGIEYLYHAVFTTMCAERLGLGDRYLVFGLEIHSLPLGIPLFNHLAPACTPRKISQLKEIFDQQPCGLILVGEQRTFLADIDNDSGCHSLTFLNLNSILNNKKRDMARCRRRVTRC
jgi:hypothetical protein